MYDEHLSESVFCNRRRDSGFTLIELLVVIAIIVLLLAIIIPSLRQTRQQARKVICMSNLRNIGTAVHAYANDCRETIPFGPAGLPMMGGNFYTVTGDVTSLISLTNGVPVGLGLLLQSYLQEQPKVLFCPAADQPSDAENQLARVGIKQAQGDYYYRHASVALLTGTPDLSHTKLNSLGKNRNGKKISALVMDVQFLAHPSLSSFQVLTRTSHKQQLCNFLFADNRVESFENENQRFTVDVGIYPYDALDKILKVFELADELR